MPERCLIPFVNLRSVICYALVCTSFLISPQIQATNSECDAYGGVVAKRVPRFLGGGKVNIMFRRIRKGIGSEDASPEYLSEVVKKGALDKKQFLALAEKLISYDILGSKEAVLLRELSWDYALSFEEVLHLKHLASQSKNLSAEAESLFAEPWGGLAWQLSGESLPLSDLGVKILKRLEADNGMETSEDNIIPQVNSAFFEHKENPTEADFVSVLFHFLPKVLQQHKMIKTIPTVSSQFDLSRQQEGQLQSRIHSAFGETINLELGSEKTFSGLARTVVLRIEERVGSEGFASEIYREEFANLLSSPENFVKAVVGLAGRNRGWDPAAIEVLRRLSHKVALEVNHVFDIRNAFAESGRIPHSGLGPYFKETGWGANLWLARINADAKYSGLSQQNDALVSRVIKNILKKDDYTTVQQVVDEFSSYGRVLSSEEFTAVCITLARRTHDNYNVDSKGLAIGLLRLSRRFFVSHMQATEIFRAVQGKNRNGIYDTIIKYFPKSLPIAKKNLIRRLENERDDHARSVILEEVLPGLTYAHYVEIFRIYFSRGLGTESDLQIFRRFSRNYVLQLDDVRKMYQDASEFLPADGEFAKGWGTTRWAMEKGSLKLSNRSQKVVASLAQEKSPSVSEIFYQGPGAKLTADEFVDVVTTILIKDYKKKDENIYDEDLKAILDLSPRYEFTEAHRRRMKEALEYKKKWVPHGFNRKWEFEVEDLGDMSAPEPTRLAFGKLGNISGAKRKNEVSEVLAELSSGVSAEHFVDALEFAYYRQLLKPADMPTVVTWLQNTSSSLKSDGKRVHLAAAGAYPQDAVRIQTAMKKLIEPAVAKATSKAVKAGEEGSRVEALETQVLELQEQVRELLEWQNRTFSNRGNR